MVMIMIMIKGMRTLMGTPLQRENARLVHFITLMPRHPLLGDFNDHCYPLWISMVNNMKIVVLSW